LFAAVILPGFDKLDSKVIKQGFKRHTPGFSNFRFATAEEREQKTYGMQATEYLKNVVSDGVLPYSTS
jgi:hypothetical protein